MLSTVPNLLWLPNNFIGKSTLSFFIVLRFFKRFLYILSDRDKTIVCYKRFTHVLYRDLLLLYTSLLTLTVPWRVLCCNIATGLAKGLSWLAVSRATKMRSQALKKG